MKSGIYKICCLRNGKYYIGSAKNIRKRWLRHLNDLKNNKHINTYLQRAYNKYGESDFTLEIIEYCSEENLLIREQYYLDILKPYVDNFNIGDSAIGGDNISNHPNHDEIVSKISAGLYRRYEKETAEEKLKRILNKCGNKNPNYGKKWNDKQRERMSKQRKGLSSGRKGKTFEDIYGEEKSIELKEGLSKNMKERVGEKNPFYGKKHTEKNLIFYSESQKNKPTKGHISKLKPFYIDDKIYFTLNQAAQELGINYLTIRNRIISKKFKNYQYIIDDELIEKLKVEYMKQERLNGNL